MNIHPRIEYCVKGATHQNFGDYLPVLFAQYLLDRPRVEADVFRLVGSVISTPWVFNDLRCNIGAELGAIAYWGCGMRDPTPLSETAKSFVSFYGVRGPLTRDALGLSETTVLGDPGLLVPIIHSPRVHSLTNGRTLCIPHFEDPKTSENLFSASGADILVSPIVDANEQSLRELLDKITSADFVLTGSLHAGIIAFAYGRPFAFWESGHIDIPFKFQDFLSSIGASCSFARNLAEGREIYQEEIASKAKKLPLAPILEVCPFIPKPGAILRALAYDGVASAESLEEVATSFDNFDVLGGGCGDVYRRIVLPNRINARERLTRTMGRCERKTKNSAKKVLKRLRLYK